MPVFKYEARDTSGSLVRDEIEAPNLRAAVQELQAQKLTVIYLKQGAAEPSRCKCGRVWQRGETMCAECGKIRPKAPTWPLWLVAALIGLSLWYLLRA